MLNFLGMGLLICGVAHASSVHQAIPQFTDDERTHMVAFWAAPNRYAVDQSAIGSTPTSWKVRQTAEGSLWLWSLTKGHKTAASLVGGSGTPVCPDPTWDEWIGKKVRHDRWLALHVARSANALLNMGQLPPTDKDTPDLEPEVPGTMPEALLEANGPAPSFAQAVLSHKYQVSFDDLTLKYEDSVRMSNPRYAYFRAMDGVESSGMPLRSFPAERLQKVLDLAGCDLTRAKVLRAVSPLEGGFDAVNTYDTGFVSIGFIQFASLKEGAGSLGAMLQLYKITDPVDFSTDFHRYGVEVQSDGTLEVLDPSTGVEYFGADANSKIIQDKRLTAVFQRAGRLSDAFCATQVKSAIAQYYPSEDPISIVTPDGSKLLGKVGDVIRSEAGMATLFDRKVNTGNINALAKISSQVAAVHHCQSLEDLAKYEKEIVNGMKYRLDFTQDLSLSQPAGSR